MTQDLSGRLVSTEIGFWALAAMRGSKISYSGVCNQLRVAAGSFRDRVEATAVRFYGENIVGIRAIGIERDFIAVRRKRAEPIAKGIVGQPAQVRPVRPDDEDVFLMFANVPQRKPVSIG